MREKKEEDRLFQAISKGEKSMSLSLSEWVNKAKEVNRFLEEVGKYMERSNLIIKDLNQVIHLSQEHEKEIKEHADHYIELIRNRPRSLKAMTQWLLKVTLAKKERKGLEKVYTLILEERYVLNKELYKANETFLDIEGFDWKIEVLRQTDLDSANKLIIKRNHAKEENETLLNVNKTIKEVMR